MVFFGNEMTAYELRISDWSSDVCSSDLDGKDLVNDARCLDDAADARLHQRREPGVGKQAAQPDHGGKRCGDIAELVGAQREDRGNRLVEQAAGGGANLCGLSEQSRRGVSRSGR